MRVWPRWDTQSEPPMPDLIFLVLGAGAFAGFIAYTLLCERL